MFLLFANAVWPNLTFSASHKLLNCGLQYKHFKLQMLSKYTSSILGVTLIAAGSRSNSTGECMPGKSRLVIRSLLPPANSILRQYSQPCCGHWPWSICCLSCSLEGVLWKSNLTVSNLWWFVLWQLAVSSDVKNKVLQLHLSWHAVSVCIGNIRWFNLDCFLKLPGTYPKTWIHSFCTTYGRSTNLSSDSQSGQEGSLILLYNSAHVVISRPAILV